MFKNTNKMYDYFPRQALPIPFDNFLYTISSKPIKAGDMIAFGEEVPNDDDLEAQHDIYFVFGVCVEVGSEEGYLTMSDGGGVGLVPISSCIRLTFTVPITNGNPAYAN